MKYLLTVAMFIATMNSFAQNVALKTKSFSVKFVIKNAGIKVNGYFKTGNADIVLNETNIAASSFVGSVQTNSINTGISLRDKHLMEKSEYFQPVTYPKIVMKSGTVSKDKNNVISVSWTLTMKNISKTFTSPISIVKNTDGTYAMTSTFRINRLDFDIGGKSILMADNVDIIVSAVASK